VENYNEEEKKKAKEAGAVESHDRTPEPGFDESGQSRAESLPKTLTHQEIRDRCEKGRTQ